MNSRHSSSVRVTIIKARWHADIVDQCADSFQAEIEERCNGNVRINHLEVPGAYEIPLAAKRVFKKDQADILLACAFVVDGGIYRHDFVSSAVIDGMMSVQLEAGRPILSAVLTPHAFQESEFHITAFKTHFATKGREAAVACEALINLGCVNT